MRGGKSGSRSPSGSVAKADAHFYLSIFWIPNLIALNTNRVLCIVNYTLRKNFFQNRKFYQI